MRHQRRHDRDQHADHAEAIARPARCGRRQAAQGEDEIAPIERPGGIAVHHQEHVATTLVQVVVAEPAHGDHVR